jgi:hypothetical protein
MKQFKFAAIIFLSLIMLGSFVPSYVFATAETLTSTRGVAGFPVYGRGQAGNLKSTYGVYAVTAAVEAGDVFQLARVPRGATVVGGRFYMGDMDGGTAPDATLDIDIGWATAGTNGPDPDGLLNGGTIHGDAVVGVKPESGTSMPFGGVLIISGSKTFTEETALIATVNTAAATFAAATMGIVVDYTMD